MKENSDLLECAEAIRHGSLSFHAASRLLPNKIRLPSLALYAFCRVADDAVDLRQDKARAVERLRIRLDGAFLGRPENTAIDRAFAQMIAEYEMPRALPDALLEGLAWDAEIKRYDTLSDVLSYSARVASAVGAMMCVLMRVRDPHVLARACDLGAAMQLTNIARDIGEDAREGRLYLPLAWLDEAGLSPERFLAEPRASKAIRQMTRRLLIQAERLYNRSEAGITFLPLSARPGIFAARYIYAGIGQAIQTNGHDSIARRAHTSRAQKIGWLAQASLRAGLGAVMPHSPVLYAQPLEEMRFLIEAAAIMPEQKRSWSDALYRSMAALKEHDLVGSAILINDPKGSG